MTTRMTLTTAAAMLMTSTAFAAEHMSDSRSVMHSSTTEGAMTTMELANADADLIRSRDITGGTIYTTNEAYDEGWNVDTIYNSVDNNWNQIGQIEDLVLTEDGKVTGIVAEVGGYLDIGDKHVVISVSDLNLVAVDDATYAYVTRFNEEELEGMPSVDEGFWN